MTGIQGAGLCSPRSEAQRRCAMPAQESVGLWRAATAKMTPPPLRGDNCQVEVSDQAHNVTIVSSE